MPIIRTYVNAGHARHEGWRSVKLGARAKPRSLGELRTQRRPTALMHQRESAVRSHPAGPNCATKPVNAANEFGRRDFIKTVLVARARAGHHPREFVRRGDSFAGHNSNSTDNQRWRTFGRSESDARRREGGMYLINVFEQRLWNTHRDRTRLSEHGYQMYTRVSECAVYVCSCVKLPNSRRNSTNHERLRT